MADSTDMMISGIRTEVHLVLKEGRERAKADTAEAVKAADKAAAAAAKTLDKKIAELAGTKTRGPAVIAVLSVVFLILLAYAVGWTMGHAGIAVMQVFER